MSGKSIEYWRMQWNCSSHNTDAWKCLDLLSQYSGFYKHDPIFGFRMPWGGSIGRFFKGHWNTHHGKAVKNAIDAYFHVDTIWAIDDTYHNTKFILCQVKKNIDLSKLKPNGDLARILQVIQEKTGVDIKDLDENKPDDYLPKYQTNR